MSSHFSYPFTIFRDAGFGRVKKNKNFLGSSGFFLRNDQDDATLESTIEIWQKGSVSWQSKSLLHPILFPGNYHRYGVLARGDLGGVVQWQLLWMIGLPLLWFIMVWSYYYIAVVATVYGNGSQKLYDSSIASYWRVVSCFHPYPTQTKSAKNQRNTQTQGGNNIDHRPKFPKFPQTKKTRGRKPEAPTWGVDMSMNVHMKNIKFTVKGKPPVSMDHLTIRGNNVRSGKPGPMEKAIGMTPFFYLDVGSPIKGM